MLEKVLLEHYKRYPKMQEIDMLKLIFQATLGPNHFYKPTKEKLLERIIEERKDLILKNELVIEDIGNDYIRLYLDSNISNEKIIDMFIYSMEHCKKDIELFNKEIDILLNLIENKLIVLSKDKVLEILKEVKENNYAPLSHSKEYKEAYNPHYRLIKKEALKS